MKRLVCFLVVLTLLGVVNICKADESPTTIQAISVTDTITSLKDKAVDMGVFYNLRDNSVQPCYTYTMFHSGSWDILNMGYANPNVLIVGPAYNFVVKDFMTKHNITAPFPFVKKITDNLTIDFSLNAGIEEISGKNKITGGPGITFKISI